MQTLLDRMDRTSMHVGLEARVPFADHRIVEYAWNIPWEMKCHGGVVKGLLRATGESYLPGEVLYRKKSPYPKTYHPKYEEILIKNFIEVINTPNEPINELIDKNKALSFVKDKLNYTNPWYGQLMAGPQLIAYMLQVNYWMKLWT
jgi:asparagine synthase (glutamine-hydrolysing)